MSSDLFEKTLRFPNLTKALSFIEERWGAETANSTQKKIEEIKNNRELMEKISHEDTHSMGCNFPKFHLVFYLDKDLVRIGVKL